MKRNYSLGAMSVLMVLATLFLASDAFAQAVTARLGPSARIMVNQANKLYSAPDQREGFLITKARQFLETKRYQPALDLANYVLTLNPGSPDAQKILAGAKVALEQMAQERISQAQKKIADSLQPSEVQTNAARQEVIEQLDKP